MYGWKVKQQLFIRGSIMFEGSLVAIVTPFKDNKIDEKALKNLIEFQIENGTNGIVPCGTTGESPTLNFQEHEKVIDIAIQTVKGRVPVIAGTGANSTAEAVMLTKHAAKAGADASLQVSPYYNKPTQKGLYLHFKTIADSVDIPLILYNIQGRTAINIEPETIGKLARDCKNIVGVKEASGNLDQMARVKAACPEDFLLISGDDSLTLPLLGIGGVGVISVVANIVPADVVAMIKAFKDRNVTEAQRIHYRLLPLVKAMFIETNPIPVKTALALMKLIEPGLRLPLCEMKEENLTRLKTVLKDYRLIKE
jgi:4-hydroxy-tetrahydrodipicolinate synthase